MEENIKYPIYARTDENGAVTKIFSTAFEQPTATDTLIESENTNRQGANKYQVRDEKGILNYEIVDGKLVERDKTADLAELEKDKLRQRRDKECFSIIDRAAWYASLTTEQQSDVQKWRKEWCDVTKTFVIPERPSWLTADGTIIN